MNVIHKAFFATVLSACFVVSSFAQNDAKKVRIGLRGSGNVSWLKPNNNGSYGYERKGLRLGYSAGLMFDFSLFDSNNYGLVTGVNLLYHSGKLNYPDVVDPSNSVVFLGTTTATYHLRYIELPLILKLKTNEIGYLTYYGEVGLGLGLNIKARQDWTQEYSAGEYTPQDQNIDISSEILFARVPLIIGVGTEYNLSGNTSIMIGLTFNNGFTNVFTKEAALYEVDSAGEVKLDADNEPIRITGEKRNALTNYIGVNLGVLF